MQRWCSFPGEKRHLYCFRCRHNVTAVSAVYGSKSDGAAISADNNTGYFRFRRQRNDAAISVVKATSLLFPPSKQHRYGNNNVPAVPAIKATELQFPPSHDDCRRALTFVDAEWRGVDAEWRGVDAEWRGVDAEWRGVAAEWRGVAAEWRAVEAEWRGVDAEWRGVEAECCLGRGVAQQQPRKLEQRA
ncbi:unnamed protein product [Closterium sp. Yama58-4]|nr:unnamed protein product [Closterium sp. Yama58-4]